MNIQDYGLYFFSVIQKSPGQPADDYEAVLGASTIPAGLPQYQVPDASMPHHALTQQIGTDGRIAGRMFLPTAAPDELGYYSHPVSPLRDGPTPGTLLWEWRDLGGPPVVTPGDSGSGTQPPAGITEEQVQAMIDAAVAPLTSQMATMQEALAAPLRAHGPVNLPIVVESLTSMRAKGDIDVDVLPGTATPPADTSGDAPDISGAALLLWLRKRDDAGEQP
jgi:hypothetical protein